MNVGLSFSVHDVSEQAIAHLAYLDVRFPNACYAGDTVTASSKVLAKKLASSGDKGVVHVRTVVTTEGDVPVCVFERKALVRAGTVEGRPEAPFVFEQPDLTEVPFMPAALRGVAKPPARRGGFAGFFEDFAEGDVFCHQVGKTVGDTEHMQLTLLLRNSHPIHFDEVYCKEGKSFAGTRVVYGGLVFGFVASLASRDVAGNAIWDLGYDEGAHPNGVVAGDTLFAASKVIGTKDLDAPFGEVTFRLVGVKNERPDAILASGKDLFAPELGKKNDDERIGAKVFEITRRVAVLKQSVA
jgi:2-methylfumaryl-CoA hydratase